MRLLRSPLTEVVCQVRFPPILRIVNEAPAAFQECIRERFPRFETEDGFLFQLQFSGSEPIPSSTTHPTSRLFRFQDAEGDSAVTLSTDFFALSTSRYTVWEDFAQDLALIQEAVQATYAPGFSTRVGLRYVDRLVPSKLGLATFDDVLALLRPELTSLFRVSVWDPPAELLCQLILPDQDGTLGLRFGTQRTADELTFVLDFDYYEDQELPFEGLTARCHRYHDSIYDAFRWCINDDQFHVFQPVAKEGERP